MDLPVIEARSDTDWGYRVGEAFREHAGFALLKPPQHVSDLYDDVFDVWDSFLELDDEVRRQYQAPAMGGEVGFSPMYTESNRLQGEETSEDEGNPNRYYMIGRGSESVPGQLRNMFPRTPFPDEELPAFQEKTRALYQELDELAEELLEGLTTYAEEDRGTKLIPGFDDYARQGNTILRLLDYPERDEVDPEESRIGAHEDRGLITLLKTDGVGGLEVLTGEDPRDAAHWSAVDNDPENLVINIGEAMALLTNDFYPATKHRVVSTTTEPRQSMPFFVHAAPTDHLAAYEPFLRDQPLNEEWEGGEDMASYFLQNINKRRRDGFGLDHIREKEFKALNEKAWEEGADVYQVA